MQDFEAKGAVAAVLSEYRLPQVVGLHYTDGTYAALDEPVVSSAAVL